MPFTLPFYASTILRQPVHGRVKKKLAYRAMPFTSLKKLKSVRFTGVMDPLFLSFSPRSPAWSTEGNERSSCRYLPGYQSFTSRDIRSPATRKSVLVLRDDSACSCGTTCMIEERRIILVQLLAGARMPPAAGRQIWRRSMSGERKKSGCRAAPPGLWTAMGLGSRLGQVCGQRCNFY